MWVWPVPNLLLGLQFHIPLNCNAAGAGYQPNVNPRSFILPLQLGRRATPWKRGKFTPQQRNVSKPHFQSFSISFCVFSLRSCNFGLSCAEQKGRNPQQRMCQSLGIPMPKFSISTVPSSHGSSERGRPCVTSEIFARASPYCCHHCLLHHGCHDDMVAFVVIAINQNARFPRMGSQRAEGEESPSGRAFQLSIGRFCCCFAIHYICTTWHGSVQ